MLSLRMAPALTQKHSLEIRLHLRQFFGETIGDIPLYSLHRIRNMMEKFPITISPDLKTLFIGALASANADYKAESGNDWSCLTSNNLVSAIEQTDVAIEEAVKRISLPEEQAELRGKLLERLDQVRVQSILAIQQWFETHYDSLLYNMSGNVPWSVVRRLKRNLSFWIATKGNRFGDDIEEVILDIAKEEGIDTEDPETAWEKMGGKVFKQEP